MLLNNNLSTFNYPQLKIYRGSHHPERKRKRADVPVYTEVQCTSSTYLGTRLPSIATRNRSCQTVRTCVPGLTFVRVLWSPRMGRVNHVRLAGDTLISLAIVSVARSAEEDTYLLAYIYCNAIRNRHSFILTSSISNMSLVRSNTLTRWSYCQSSKSYMYFFFSVALDKVVYHHPGTYDT